MQGKTFEEVKQIQERFMAQYWNGSNAMNGVGIGEDDAGNFCLRVYFETEDGRSAIPSEFEGVKVITEVIGVIRPQ